MNLLFKILIIISTFSSLLFSNSDRLFTHFKNSFDSIIVKDLNKKQIIYQKYENKKIRPASLTKIMTTVIAIESGKMNSIVKITPEMLGAEPIIIGLKVGDEIFLKDLVHAALINSANDAASAIAVFLGEGNKKRFVHSMNVKARVLKMKDTKFENPCGFDHDSHKTTANDLVKLTEYAINNRTFNEIVKKESYSFKALNTKREYFASSTNKLLGKEKYILGIKTGYTSKAGPCLISRAKDKDKDLLLVILNSSNRWEITKSTFDTLLKKK